MNTASGITLFAGAACFIALGIYVAVSVWSECLATNSFLYCAVVIGGK